MKLSILICSIECRKASLDLLLKMLRKQKTNQVEILVEKDKGRMVIGVKRNILLRRACGDYICFVDDDDTVSEDYISRILGALETNPDCCGIEGIITRRKSTNLFIHSIKYKTWFERGGVYYRCPNHLNPVKRELAYQAGFPNSSLGEDRVYSQRLLPLLKKEVYLKGPIYFYSTVQGGNL